MDLRKLFDDLVRFETDMWNAIDARVQGDCGVSLGTLNVLLVIETGQTCRVNDIAAALSITVGGASQAVDRLELRELVTRRPNPADRRSSVVELTNAGREAIKNAGPVFDEELASWFGTALDSRSLASLGRAMSTLRRAARDRRESK